MLEFSIAIVILVSLILIFYSITIKIRVARFLSNVEFVAVLENWLLESDEIEQKYEDTSFGLVVGKYYVEFDKFVGAINYLEEYAKEIKEEYQKIIELTDDYNLAEKEKILDQTLYKIRMWRWKHNCIEI